MPTTRRKKSTKESEPAATWVAIDALTPWADNPRKNDGRPVEAVADSIKRFGFAAPIIARQEDGMVIAGHTRLKAAIKLGLDRVPVRYLDLDPADSRLLALADNKVGELAEWDDEALARIVADIDGAELALAGFTEEDLAALIDSEPEPDFGAALEPEGAHDDELPEEVEPITKPGDVVELGPHVLHCGDCIEVMQGMAENSVDAIVTDPPYGLGFMGKAWDALPPGLDWARECHRVLKPGGAIVAFGGQRTIHRLTCSLEDAGFEIRDLFGWLQWQGFPKSLDASKALDKRRHDREQTEAVVRWMEATRESAGVSRGEVEARFGTKNIGQAIFTITPGSSPRVPTLEQIPILLDLFGVELEQVPEDIRDLIWTLNGRKGQPGEAWFRREVVGTTNIGRLAVAPGQGEDRSQRKINLTAPATEDARTWEGFGSGLKPCLEPAVIARKPLVGTVAENLIAWGTGALNIDGCRYAYGDEAWPGPQSAEWSSHPGVTGGGVTGYQGGGGGYSGAASRSDGRWPANVYATPKASRSEREAGCEGLPGRTGADAVEREEGSAGTQSPRAGAGRTASTVRNHHPTVKPVKLMRWLCVLVGCQPGSTILEPFAGSGTTMLAAHREGFKCVAIEREPAYCDIVRARLGAVLDE